MRVADVVHVAGRALLRNKMRSFLTALGIIIGVGAVIAMVAIGEGARARVEQAFSSMGTNVLIVSSGAKTSGGAKAGAGTLPTLTWDDMRAIRDGVTDVRYVAPRVHATAQIVAEDRNWSTAVNGTTPEMFEIRNWPAQRGALLTTQQVDSGAKAVVLGATVARNLFGASTDPTGQMVRIANVPFQVVGVAAAKGQSAGGNDYDDVAFVPVTTFMAKIQGGLQKFIPGTILVEVTNDDVTVAVGERVAALLRDRHGIPTGGDDDFSIKNLTETASRKEESTEALTLLLASIAGVSLLVGGIGIMNIMLVSVTERTREIGVRMAVGAKPRHVRLQFLAEALALALAGGLHRRRRGHVRRRTVGDPLRLADAGASRRRRGRCRIFGGGRYLLRPLPRSQGVAPGSDPGAPVRMMTHAIALAAIVCARTVTLDQAEQAAETQAPAVREARADAAAGQARTEVARAPALPQVKIEGIYERTTGNRRQRPGRTTFVDNSWTTYNWYEARATASQLLWDFGHTLNRWRAAEARAVALNDTARASLLEALSTVRTAYFNARATKELIVGGEDRRSPTRSATSCRSPASSRPGRGPTSTWRRRGPGAPTRASP